MLRFIACTLTLLLVCLAVRAAEDRAADQQGAQDQPAATPAPAQPAAADAAKDQPAKDRYGKAAAEDLAQPAAAREEAEQDPTKSFIKEAWNCNLFEVKAAQVAERKLR